MTDSKNPTANDSAPFAPAVHIVTDSSCDLPASLADELGIPLLGQLPLVPALREGGDQGRPITAVDPDSESAKAFFAIAERIAVEFKPKKIFSPQLKIL